MLFIRFRTERKTDGKAMIPSSLQSRPRVRQDMTQRKDRPIHRFTLLWLSIRQRRDNKVTYLASEPVKILHILPSTTDYTSKVEEVETKQIVL
jgi:hypothetical protein